MGSGGFLVTFILSKTEKSTDELKQCLTELNGNGSVLVDILTTSISASLMILGSLIIIIQFGNYKMKEALCDFSVSKKKTTSSKISLSKSVIVVASNHFFSCVFRMDIKSMFLIELGG